MSGIPVILLTGYLGAGKTSVLNALLRSDRVVGMRPALIINEFGEMGVDGSLVQSANLGKFEINQGSIFCTCTRDRFVLTLNAIARAGGYGVVLVESTGISETRNLEGAMAIPALTDAFHVRANVCVVDALNFTKVAPFLELIKEQVRCADGIVVNKTDLVAVDALGRVEEVLRSLNPRAGTVRASFGGVDADFVLGLRHAGHEGPPLDSPPADIVAVSIRADRPGSRAQFAEAVRTLGNRLLRLKGNVEFAGEGRRFVEIVYDRLTEKSAAPGLGAGTAFTAIGWQIGAEDLGAALRQAFGH
jgi:G3E family GTPase